MRASNGVRRGKKKQGLKYIKYLQESESARKYLSPIAPILYYVVNQELDLTGSFTKEATRHNVTLVVQKVAEVWDPNTRRSRVRVVGGKTLNPEVQSNWVKRFIRRKGGIAAITFNFNFIRQDYRRPVTRWACDHPDRATAPPHPIREIVP